MATYYLISDDYSILIIVPFVPFSTLPLVATPARSSSANTLLIFPEFQQSTNLEEVRILIIYDLITEEKSCFLNKIILSLISLPKRYEIGLRDMLFLRPKSNNG